MDPVSAAMLLALIGIPLQLVRSGATDVASVIKGQEAPSLTKFKMRHEKGATVAHQVLTRPTRKGKKPGPFLQYLRAVAGNYWMDRIEKVEHRAYRRRRWYREYGATIEDEKWHLRQREKLKKMQRGLDKRKRKLGLLEPDPALQQGSERDPGRPQSDNNTAKVASLDEHRRAKDTAKKPEAKNPEAKNPEAKNPETQSPAQPSAKSAAPAATAGATSAATNNTPRGEGMSLYRDASERVASHAEQISEFARNIETFADGLADRKWSEEVVGVARDMAVLASEAAGALFETAANIRAQGDSVRQSLEGAPWTGELDRV